MKEIFPANVSKLQRGLEAGPLTGKRVLFIGDREINNFAAARDYANHTSEIQLAGLIVPGGELDDDIVQAADYFQDMRSDGIAMPIEEEGGSLGYHFSSTRGADFSYEHAPYEKERLRDEEYRREYCLRLVQMAERARPDIIFLSNFKVILHSVFVKAFEGKIVNVHPSMLPLLKGFRPEFRADQGEEAQANGYTMHLVDTDLDGGPTLFQQHVPLELQDPGKKAELGEKEYNKRREEAHRLKIIQAQARWSPQVLALVSSDTPRKIVSGVEAFTVEGRPDFEQTEAYKHLLEKEYEEWKTKGENASVTFENWQKLQKPYSRVLFNKGSGWQTAEMILGAPQESDERSPDIITRYSFKIPGGNPLIIQERFARLMRLADEIREKRGLSGGIKTGYALNSFSGSNFARAHIEFPYDAQEEFESLIKAEMSDVTLKIETKPTRVFSPRVPPRSFDEELS